MMPFTTPTTPPSPFPTAIIHPQYCAPYPVGLVLKKEKTVLHKYTLFRDRWKAFRGQNMEQLEFFTRNVDVFLANNITGVCDFKHVEAGFFARTWVLNIAESDIDVAQVYFLLVFPVFALVWWLESCISHLNF
ncbi:hypothetical protein S83_012763 [Arachis hypogaea]